MALYGISTTITYTAYDGVANAPKTGDVANHTLRWVKDGVSAAPTNSPAEVDAVNAPGIYKLVLTATEAQAVFGTLGGKSATSGVSIVPQSLAFERLPNVDPGSNGGLPTVDATNGVSLTALASNVLHSGTAQAAAAGTITLAAGASAVDNYYVGTSIKVYGGTGAGQTRVILSYVGATKVATLSRNWKTVPDVTSTYAVLSTAVPKVNDSLEVVSASVTAGVTASATVPLVIGPFGRKYGTATTAGLTAIRLALKKAGGTAFATGSDWTPAAGDVKVSINGAAEANIVALPTFANGAWEFALSAGELTGKQIEIRVAATAVDPAFAMIETFGNAAAMYPDDATAAGITTNDVRDAILTDATRFPGADIALIKTQTDKIPASPAAVSDIPTASAVATATAADILVTPAQKLVTDASGFVTSTNTGTGLTTTQQTQLADAATHATAVDSRLPTSPADESLVIAATNSLAAAIAALPTAVQNADALLVRNAKGGANGPTVQSVAAALAGGLMLIDLTGGILTVQYGDGTTAFTRPVTRAVLDAILKTV